MTVYDCNGNPVTFPPPGYNWTGKVMSIDGDSHVMNSTTAFGPYMVEQLGVDARLIGIPGVPVMGDYPGTEKDFRRRVSNIPADDGWKPS